MPRTRLVAPDAEPQDETLQWGLRPRLLDEYVGQQKAVERIGIAISAARRRGEPLDHVLLHGPPGLGKTTMAYIIAEELGHEIQPSSGPALERPGDLLAHLTTLGPGDVLFIDEIHRLPHIVEEYLFQAMEDFVVTFSLDKGVYSKPVPFKLEHFTLVGATTRPAMLSRPLRDRFGIQQHLDFYNEDDLQKIALRSAGLLGAELEPAAAQELARRARGTPRIVNRLLRRVRDYADVKAEGRLTLPVTGQALELEGIDHLGLDRLDQNLLQVIMDVYQGGPVGVEALAATLNEEADTIYEVVEPYLLKIGFLARTPAGRRITLKAYRHLGVEPPVSAPGTQPTLGL